MRARHREGNVVGATPGDRGAWARRDVVRVAAAGAVGAAPGGRATLRRLTAGRGGGPEGPGAYGALGALGGDPVVIIDGSAVRTLALRALDAAKSAGAHYADVRFTRRLRQKFKPDATWHPGQVKFTPSHLRLDGAYERLGVGVRVRVGAGWGFAASPYWDPEDVGHLAREAVAQAQANAPGSGPVPEWTPTPVAHGHWTTPITVDPFVVSLEEKTDLFGLWMAAAYRLPRGVMGAQMAADFTREERALATSEGTYVTQTLYTSEGAYAITRTTLQPPQQMGVAVARGLARTTAGWELFTAADIPGQLPRLWEEADPLKPQGPAVARKPGDIGRYPVVFDARSMGLLVERTLGVATQLDRALGLEANAGGTSYLGPDPLALLGHHQAASPVVTVTANRSMPGGFATVGWDDEGVVPEPFPLVKDGLLVDYQTTRELAPVLAPYYQQVWRPVRSHGCAGSESALGVTLAQVPNLVLEPGVENLDFAALVGSVKRGLAVLWEDPVTKLGRTVVGTDFQARTGAGHAGQLREIVDGKLGAEVQGLTFTFSTPSLWKNVLAVGGAASAVQYATRARKGEPAQQTVYSVRAVPAVVKDVDFITPPRR